MGIEELKQHYNHNYKNKIFFKEVSIHGKEFSIMYVHNKNEEMENFKQTFGHYLPFYIRNADQLEKISIGSEIDKILENRSKSIWKSSTLIPNRNTKINGIFGELYLDFYERIVRKNKILISYASKSNFSSNIEKKGFDNFTYTLKNNQMEIIFCEAKFVTDIYTAKNCLIEDIKGKTITKEGVQKNILGHLTKEFINSYIQFVLEKNIEIEENDKIIANDFINELNKQLDEGNKFLEIIIDNNIPLRFVFFAIFSSNELENPNYFENYYDSIKKEADVHIEKLGVTNYKIEIVFIPTFNKSMDLKLEIEKFYE